MITRSEKINLLNYKCPLKLAIEIAEKYKMIEK